MVSGKAGSDWVSSRHGVGFCQADRNGRVFVSILLVLSTPQMQDSTCREDCHMQLRLYVGVCVDPSLP